MWIVSDSDMKTPWIRARRLFHRGRADVDVESRPLYHRFRRDYTIGLAANKAVRFRNSGMRLCVKFSQAIVALALLLSIHSSGSATAVDGGVDSHA